MLSSLRHVIKYALTFVLTVGFSALANADGLAVCPVLIGEGSEEFIAQVYPQGGSVWVATNQDLYKIEGFDASRMGVGAGVGAIGGATRVWFSTATGALYRVGAEGTIESIVLTEMGSGPDRSSELVLRRIEAIYESSGGTAWIGARSGLYRVVAQNEGNIAVVQVIVGEEILFIGESHDSYSWLSTHSSVPVNSGVFVGTSRGLYFIEEGGEVHFLLSDQERISVLEIKAGSNGLWLLGLRSARYPSLRDLYFLQRPAATALKVEAQRIVTLEQDTRGELWLGLPGTGIKKIPKNPKPGKLSPYELETIWDYIGINVIERLGESLYVGSWKGLFQVLEKPGQKVTFREAPEGNRAVVNVSAIFESRGEIWFASRHRVCRVIKDGWINANVITGEGQRGRQYIELSRLRYDSADTTLEVPSSTRFRVEIRESEREEWRTSRILGPSDLEKTILYPEEDAFYLRVSDTSGNSREFGFFDLNKGISFVMIVAILIVITLFIVVLFRRYLISLFLDVE